MTFQKGHTLNVGRKHIKATNWKSGRRTTPRGYVYLCKPEHPNNIYGVVYEHRIVMEEKLGRYLLTNELVHHLNGIKDDNRIENLCVTDSKKHDTHSVQHFLQQRIIQLEQQLSS